MCIRSSVQQDVKTPSTRGLFAITVFPKCYASSSPLMRKVWETPEHALLPVLVCAKKKAQKTYSTRIICGQLRTRYISADLLTELSVHQRERSQTQLGHCSSQGSWSVQSLIKSGCP